jgi:hypothetical protein
VQTTVTIPAQTITVVIPAQTITLPATTGREYLDHRG